MDYGWRISSVKVRQNCDAASPAENFPALDATSPTYNETTYAMANMVQIDSEINFGDKDRKSVV